jgi:hypothetical protein
MFLTLIAGPVCLTAEQAKKKTPIGGLPIGVFFPEGSRAAFRRSFG